MGKVNDDLCYKQSNILCMSCVTKPKIQHILYTSLLETGWYQEADTILIGQWYSTSVAGNLQSYNCQDSDWEAHCHLLYALCT